MKEGELVSQGNEVLNLSPKAMLTGKCGVTRFTFFGAEHGRSEAVELIVFEAFCISCELLAGLVKQLCNP